MTCTITDFEGSGIATMDRVAVLHYCPTAEMGKEIQIGSRFDVAPSMITVLDWPRGGFAYPAKDYGVTISWGVNSVWSPAGRYALCWCISEPPGATDYRCEWP